MEQTVMEVASSDGFSAELLTRERFQFYWPKISEMMSYIPHTWSDMTKDGLYERVMCGNVQVWGVGDKSIRLVLFTQIAKYETGDKLEIFWGAGQGNVFETAGDVVDAAMDYFAKTQGCNEIRVIGREGWERILKPRGFKKVSVVLSRPIVHNGVQ